MRRLCLVLVLASIVGCSSGCSSGIERLEEIGVVAKQTLMNFKTDTGFEMIQMRSVDVSSTVDFDEFLRVARGVKNIKILRIMGQSLSCSQVDALVEMGGFTTLVFDETDVPSECLSRLAEIKTLEKLAITNSGVTSDQFAFISDLPRLNTLTLNGTKIDDSLATHLQGLEKLRYVFVSETAVTDAFAAELAKLPKLTEVHVSDTAVTSAGIAAMMTAPIVSRIHATHVPLDETLQSALRQQTPSLKTLVLDVPKTIQPTAAAPVKILPPELEDQRDKD